MQTQTWEGVLAEADESHRLVSLPHNILTVQPAMVRSVLEFKVDPQKTEVDKDDYLSFLYSTSSE